MPSMQRNSDAPVECIRVRRRVVSWRVRRMEIDRHSASEIRISKIPRKNQRAAG
jgi:hypothetical protein